MFDTLIESQTNVTETKKRRGYFLVSTLVVGILFGAAVVISIYASDFSLGSGNFELEALLAPVDMAAAAPEPPRPRNLASTQTASKSDLPTRTQNISRTDEPTLVPNGFSTEKSNLMSRPNGRFELGDENTNPVGPSRGPSDVDPTIGSTLVKPSKTSDDKEIDIEAPPVKDVSVKKHVTQSLGVINGRASFLPVPIYPATAKAVNAQGSVSVQVLIDESGNVISANATSGHPLLRDAAERAAKNARFTPTLLSKVAVKVSGVIVYNFTR